MPKRDQPLTVRLPDELKAAVRLIADVDAEGVTSEVLQAAVAAYVTRMKADPTFQQRLRAHVAVQRSRLNEAERWANGAVAE